MDYQTLAKHNNLKNPNLIYTGQVLEIPEPQTNDNITQPTPVAPESTGMEETITILGTADMHGRIYAYEYAIDEVDKDAGFAKITTLVKEERAKNPNLLLMDVGDTVQDNSAELFNDLPVHPMVEVMNDLKVDVWALGNHEFNFEKSFLERNIAAFKGAVLSANIYKEGTNERFVDGHKVFNINGVRVAVIGMIPPHVPVWEASSPEHFAGLTFHNITEETAKAIKELEGKYDVLVGAYHIGPEGEHGFDGIEKIAEKFPQFDVIFGGHAHSRYQKEVNGVQLIEPGAYGWALAKAEIKVKRTDKGVEVVSVATENIKTEKVEEDKDLLAKFEYVHQQSIADANTVIGEITADFLPQVDYITGAEKVTTMPTSQVQDTALIDLINEVQLYYTKADISAAAAFKNDMNLKKGEFKKKNVADIYKYTNTLMGINISGENLKKYMEWSASYYNTHKDGDVTISFNENIRGYNYDMFAGVTYDIDISKEAGSRITNLKLNGQPIKDDQIYKLAVNNYRFGTLMNLKLATKDDVYYDSYEIYQDNGRIRTLIAEYIKTVGQGKIGPKVDNNWQIIGAPGLKHPRAEEILQLIRDGKITIPRSEDGRTPNVKSINVHELIKEGIISKLEKYLQAA
ncbi:bifunctional metallophosphatase/5'-nucleotidase [Clostridiales bacterium COT073_COT-073]|nr:bifunctional metallophosphatase/5'-nucleotidase [Clostridiales bacterium COT073_COT-073]